jgi:O-antigen ligase
VTLSNIVKSIYSWWWPIYVFLYPVFLLETNNPGRVSVTNSKIEFTLTWAVLGLILRVSQINSWWKLSFYTLSKRLVAWNPITFLFLAYGIWSLIASCFANDPSTALTGTLVEGDEGGFWIFLLCIISLLAYSQSKEEPNFSKLIGRALVSSGLLLVLMACIEIFSGKGVIYTVNTQFLPMVTFPQKGHLSGYLGFCLVAGFFYASEKSRLYLFYMLSLLLISFILGYIQNRASLIQISIALIFITFLLGPKIGLRNILFVLLFCFLGGLFQGYTQTSISSNRQNLNTLETRVIYWRAAVNMIAQRPIFGWGAGGYYEHWSETLSFSQIRKAIYLEQGLFYKSNDGPVFYTRDKRNKLTTLIFSLWRSHNQFLEVGLIRGYLGLLIYIALLFLCFVRTNALSIAIIGYHIFLSLWYLPVESVGVLWVIWSASLGITPFVFSKPLGSSFRNTHETATIIK